MHMRFMILPSGGNNIAYFQKSKGYTLEYNEMNSLNSTSLIVKTKA